MTRTPNQGAVRTPVLRRPLLQPFLSRLTEHRAVLGESRIACCGAGCDPGVRREHVAVGVASFAFDHLADALSTLPALVRDGEDASLHFYFANLASMRKHLFPSLSRAYQSWVASGDRSPIPTLIPVSRAHWDALALQMLDLYRSQPDDLPASLQNLIENRRL